MKRNPNRNPSCLAAATGATVSVPSFVVRRSTFSSTSRIAEHLIRETYSCLAAAIGWCRFLCPIMWLLSLCHCVMTDDDGDDLNIGDFRFYLIFVSSSGDNFFNSFFLF
jgi:hypothetical protein